MLSEQSKATISDLIENRLAAMAIGDREDLREIVLLKKALAEVYGLEATKDRVVKAFQHIPRRGRRRKVNEMLLEHDPSLHRNTSSTDF